MCNTFCMARKEEIFSDFSRSIFGTSFKTFMALTSKISFIFSTTFPNIRSLQNQIGHCPGIAFLIIFQYFLFYSSWSLKYCCMQKFKILGKQHDWNLFFIHFQQKCCWFTCGIKAKLISLEYNLITSKTGQHIGDYSDIWLLKKN